MPASIGTTFPLFRAHSTPRATIALVAAHSTTITVTMLGFPPEHNLSLCLRDLPHDFNYRYTDSARCTLIEALFRSLAGRNEHLALFFPHGSPSYHNGAWSLRRSQGAVEGAEFTEAARGKPCGHIFKSGEASYACKTCSDDDTCVLCSRCFNASDHEGHTIFVSISPGNSGCCDCGDAEAWKRPLSCSIHSARPGSESAAGEARPSQPLPEELLACMRGTIARVLDYLIDVFSCAPEQLRMPKTEESILEDERNSRLTARWYGVGEGPMKVDEYALVLWNDEKHTVEDVEDQVARACKQRREFGRNKALDVDEHGRCVVVYSHNIESLLRMAKVIEEIKLTVTIRSSRDTFREQMCGTIVDWIYDIAGCSVGEDPHVLRYIVCEEMLKPWRMGSLASHLGIGQDGIFDHEREERDTAMESIFADGQLFEHQRRIIAALENPPRADAEDDDDDDDLSEAAIEVDDELPRDADGDVEMDTFETPDEALEVSEATLAGYPPPPPPPAPRQRHQHLASIESDPDPFIQQTAHAEPLPVPQTPQARPRPSRPPRPPKHWLVRPTGQAMDPALPPHENLWQRVRLDFLILYDMRMWNELRIKIRDVFISTVVVIPRFKRLLGLRFAGVYTILAQLYLIADREPDHSIINLSLQMLTTPSISAEIVQRGNFLSNLLAILYTFLTTRQVGYPWDVNPRAVLAFDAGAVTNRRIYHFFTDLRRLLTTEHADAKLREEEQFLFQFLDLVKLHQGICPNLRAVGDHLEYEADAWFNASLITRETNRLCKQFTRAFVWSKGEDSTLLARALRSTARVTTVNCMGAERWRLFSSEIKHEIRIKMVQVSELESTASYRLIDFSVAREHLSFHHGLHYLLSWFVENARAMSRDELRGLLTFSLLDLKEAEQQGTLAIPELPPDEYMLALFDYPLRVCAWIAQMKSGMWVRNGVSLRHQMNQYRHVAHREYCAQRDIFLLQTALVVCPPSAFLASMIDRFGLLSWLDGDYHFGDGDVLEEAQALDVAEELIHLLIVLLCDRAALIPAEDVSDPRQAMRRDIAHVLVFKPLAYSELNGRLSDKVNNSEDYSALLEEVADFRAPEGLHDSGLYALKEQYIDLVDPYYQHYTRNNREEAEAIYKKYKAKQTGAPASTIAWAPHLQPISSGAFQDLAAFTRTDLFVHVLYSFLGFALQGPEQRSSLPVTRIETYVQTVLHLLQVTVLADAAGIQDAPQPSFGAVVTKRARHGFACGATIPSLLLVILKDDAFKSCAPKIRQIAKSLRNRGDVVGVAWDEFDLDSGPRTPASPSAAVLQEKELRKKQALERQARVLASFKEQQSNFLRSQSLNWGEDLSDDDDEEEQTRAVGTEETWKFPSGTCILCQEETNDQRLYGTFAYAMDSGMARTTCAEDENFVREVLETPASLDRSADAIRPFGVAGWNRHTVEKLAADGTTVTTERQELGKALPKSHTRRGTVMTGCGHMMHWACFEVYMSATQRRHMTQVVRNHAERLDLKEFLCPLCKALGNVFLPILWENKTLKHPGVLKPPERFEKWIQTAVHGDARRVLPVGQRREESFPFVQAQLRHYAHTHIMSPVSSTLHQLRDIPAVGASSSATLPPSQRPFIAAIHALSQTSQREMSLQPWSTGSSATLQKYQVSMDVLIVYERLRDTLQTNDLCWSPQHGNAAGENSMHFETLSKTLACTIASMEIAQRGVGTGAENAGGTLLDAVSAQSVTHLRVLSETIDSYVAMGTLRTDAITDAMGEYLDLRDRQAIQLLRGASNAPSLLHGASNAPSPLHVATDIPPLLAQDAFASLTDCAVGFARGRREEIHHFLHLCYLAEIVRVILVFACEPAQIFAGAALPRATGWQDAGREAQAEWAARADMTDAQFNNLYRLVRFVGRTVMLQLSPPWQQPGVDDMLDRCCKDVGLLRFVYAMIRAYALPFLRKAAILMHIRYDVPFAPLSSTSPEESEELSRLSTLLMLPSLHDLFALVAEDPPNGALGDTIAGWLRHWTNVRGDHGHVESAIVLGHPAIFELVGLPENFDALSEEATRRHCPKTGKELTDPCICLFCGEIFCGQAVCCNPDGGLGGCNQHRIKCGGVIGIFLNIRKCMVLFLNGTQGTWTVAPYLDRYGEADPTLRKHHQLFLNQKRYDGLLRHVWLSHGLPSLIARRLDSDVNNGGWESL